LCLVASSILVFAAGKSIAQEPRIAAIGPTMKRQSSIRLSQCWRTMADRISEQGVGASTRRFGFKAEASYTRNYGAFGLPHHNDVLACLAGPVVYPIRRRRSAIYGEALFGAARLTSAIAQQNPSGITGGMVNYFAWALGGGAETKLSHSISVRTGANYLHTNFFVPDGKFAVRETLESRSPRLHVRKRPRMASIDELRHRFAVRQKESWLYDSPRSFFNRSFAFSFFGSSLSDFS
jgi:hypothetical protein